MPKTTNKPQGTKTINAEAEKPAGVALVALSNAFLPDGTFVAKNSPVTVDGELAQRLLSEANPSFRTA